MQCVHANNVGFCTCFEFHICKHTSFWVKITSPNSYTLYCRCVSLMGDRGSVTLEMLDTCGGEQVSVLYTTLASCMQCINWSPTILSYVVSSCHKPRLTRSTGGIAGIWCNPHGTLRAPCIKCHSHNYRECLCAWNAMHSHATFNSHLTWVLIGMAGPSGTSYCVDICHIKRFI